MNLEGSHQTVRQASMDGPEMATMENGDSLDLGFRLRILAENGFRQKIDPPEFRDDFCPSFPCDTKVLSGESLPRRKSFKTRPDHST